MKKAILAKIQIYRQWSTGRIKENVDSLHAKTGNEGILPCAFGPERKGTTEQYN